MGLEDVKNEIIDKAKQEAKKILDKAKEVETTIINEINEELKKLELKKLEEINSSIENLTKKELSQANLSAKKQLIEIKKQIIDETFEKAINAIKKIKDNKRTDLLNKILEKANKEITIDTIQCNKDDIKLIKAGNYKILSKEMIGGLVLISKDKNILLDYSYDTIIENIRNNKLQEIASILF